jgi:hypothetical protein
MKKRLFYIFIAIISVCETVQSQSADSVRKECFSFPDSTYVFSHYEPPFFLFPTPNQLLLGDQDGIIRLEYKRRKCLVVVINDSTGITQCVYMSKIKYSNDSLKECKFGYCYEFDNQGRVVSISEYRKGKKKYQWKLNWDSVRKRYE